MLNWLLNGPDWIQYRTHLDLLGKNQDDKQVVVLKESMLANPLIIALQKESETWPGYVLKRHNDAKHLIHKMAFLADLGLQAGDHYIDKIVNKILQNLSADNIPQLLVNIPKRFGGIGEDQMAWMLCDAPLLMYNALKFDSHQYPKFKNGLTYLFSLIRQNGWPCAASPELGKFRGPGRKTDPCPYANLMMLKVASVMPEQINQNETKIAIETLLNLWEYRTKQRPYLFAMGSTFSKLKAPLIWFDILHLADVLSHFHWVHDDERFINIIETIKLKEDTKGRFTAESIWRAWNSWEFGQKKQPSRWLTLLVHRIFNRLH